MLDDERPPPAAPSGGPVFPGREPPGTDLSRIIALSDGVFAFALTLLALSLAVPVLNLPGNASNSEVSGRLAHVLQGDWHVFVGYVFAFVMIAVWWTNHHRTFRFIERYDARLIWLNLILLMQIAVMPFVLSVYTSYDSTQTAVGLFAAIQATCGFTLGAIWWYATRTRLTDPKLDPRVVGYYRARGAIIPLVFLASIGVSFVSLTATEVIWVGAIFATRFSGRYGTT